MKRSIPFLFVIVTALSISLAGIVYAQDGGEKTPPSTLFFTDDLAYSVVLPDGWVADQDPDDGSLRIANSPAALQALIDDTDPQPGMIGLNVIAFPETVVTDLGLKEGASLSEIVSALSEVAVQSSEHNLRFGEVIEFDFAGHPTAGVDGQDDRADLSLVGYEIAPGYLGFALAGFAPNEGAQLGADAFKVLATVRHSFPLTGVFDDAPASLLYPEGWTVSPNLDQGIVYIGSSPEALQVDVMGEGQFGILAGSFGANLTYPNTVEAATQLAGFFVDPSSGTVMADPLTFEVRKQEVTLIDIPDIQGSHAGVVVTQAPSGEFVYVVYLTSTNESYQIELIAINMLLSINNLPSA